MNWSHLPITYLNAESLSVPMIHNELRGRAYAYDVAGFQTLLGNLIDCVSILRYQYIKMSGNKSYTFFYLLCLNFIYWDFKMLI